MVESLTVNEALCELHSLAGNDVEIQGILHFELEDIAIYHHPKSDRKVGYDSSIWLETGMGSLGFSVDVCQRLNGKLVSVRGIRRRTVEHPFGTLKAWMGSTHFLTKTLPRVKAEMSLQVLAYSMKRMINIMGIRSLNEALMGL